MAFLKRKSAAAVDLELRLSLSPTPSLSYSSPEMSCKRPCNAPYCRGVQDLSPLVPRLQPRLELTLATLGEDSLSSVRDPGTQDLRHCASDSRSRPLPAAGTSLSPPSCQPGTPGTKDEPGSSIPPLWPIAGELEGAPKRTRRKNPSHKYDADGHVWRKYSHKMLQGSDCERIYYACAEKVSAGCTARKIVDRPKEGPVNYWDEKVTVDGVHNHPPGRVQISGLTFETSAPGNLPGVPTYHLA